MGIKQILWLLQKYSLKRGCLKPDRDGCLSDSGLCCLACALNGELFIMSILSILDLGPIVPSIVLRSKQVPLLLLLIMFNF